MGREQGREIQKYINSRSIDGGNSFIEPVNLSNSINDSMDAKIELWGARSIAVIFSENNDIYYTSSVDGGISFSPPEDLSNNPETLSDRSQY